MGLSSPNSFRTSCRLSSLNWAVSPDICCTTSPGSSRTSVQASDALNGGDMASMGGAPGRHIRLLVPDARYA